MKRFLALPLIAATLVVPAGLATAADDDVKGPSCADITGSDWSYNGVPSDPQSGTTATITLFLDTASCSSVNYTLVVLDSLADQQLVSSNSVRGDGSADNTSGPGTDSVTVTADVPPGDRDGEVCLYATTSVGRHIFDRAPDENCVELIPGGSAGGGGFN